MTTYPDYIGKEAVRRLNESSLWNWPGDQNHSAVQALCQLLTETGFKEPEPRDLVFARRIASTWERINGYQGIAHLIEEGVRDNSDAMEAVRALLREYAGEEA